MAKHFIIYIKKLTLLGHGIKKIFAEAKKNKIICFSSPFDETAVNFLKNFNPPIFKIASFENTDLRLIKIVAKTKKPIIISLGMAKLKDIENAVNIARKNGCKNYSFKMHKRLSCKK